MIAEDLLRKSEARFDELTMLMSDPQIAADPNRYVKLVQEYRELEPLVALVQEIRTLKAEREDSLQLLQSSEEAEFKELAKEELARTETELAKKEQELVQLLTPKDPLDEKNVLLEIRAGTGGEEAALFATELYRMYLAFAEKKGWTVEIIDSNETELGGLKEIVFAIEGRGAYSQLRYESGTHRVQRVPETESGGRIHTSAATVAVLPEAEDLELDINPNDLQIDVYRASGAGGQHVNKTSSAIRITHLPTGLVVTCQDQRSQHKNKDRALKVLRSRLLEQQSGAQEAAIANERKAQVGSGDRSERIRTYNYPQGRVTDHRVNLSIYQLEQVLAGEIDSFITALQAAAHEGKLDNASQNSSN